MTIDEMLADIRNQFESKESYTAYGEPEAWIHLENGRNIQIVHEEEYLLPDNQFFSVTLHCSDEEYNNLCYHGSCGVITVTESYDTPNSLDIGAVRRPLEYILRVNESEKVMR